MKGVEAGGEYIGWWVRDKDNERERVCVSEIELERDKVSEREKKKYRVSEKASDRES